MLCIDYIKQVSSSIRSQNNGYLGRGCNLRSDDMDFWVLIMFCVLIWVADYLGG